MKKIFTFASILLVFSAVTTRAANFVTKASQGSTANWTAAIWSNPPNATATAPTSGNTYELIFNGTAYGNNTADTRTRNPQVAGTQTFPGDSLTLDANTDIRCKLASGAAVILNFPGVGGNPGLILNGGALNPGDDGVFEFQGKINVLSDSVLAMADNGLGTFKPLRGIRFNAALSGTGSLIVLQGVTSIPCAEVVSANNTYSGTWIVKAGYLKGTGSGSLG